MKQRSNEWHKFRKGHIGSSDIAVIMGISQWSTIYKLWLDKTHDVEEHDNPAMEYGRRMESTVLEMYNSRTDDPMMPTGTPLVYNKWPIASVSLDGINIDCDKICEIKCPRRAVIEMAQNGELPTYYMAQVQWQLMVTGAKSCDFVVYDSAINDIIIVNVLPDPIAFATMLEAAKEFWEFVQSMQAPERTMKDHEQIESPVFSSLAKEYIGVDERIKELELIKKALKEKLLKESDEKPVQGFGLKVSFVSGRKSVDMASLKAAYMISEEAMKAFQKEGKGYWTINISDAP